MSYQVIIVSLNELIPDNHRYRQFKSLWSFSQTNRFLKKLEKDNPHKGYGMVCLFKCLLLQFMEDLSDRQLERFLQENTAAKWFCGFELARKTPDHTVFSRVRDRIGTPKLAELFALLRDQLKQQGYLNQVFSVVDASHLISKAALWKERDKAIKATYDTLNNKVLPHVARDTEARIGCKGKNKYWYGYKRHVSVDIQSGLINRVATTAANLPDGQGLDAVCPDQGAIYADKAYSVPASHEAAAKRGCHLAAIQPRNRKTKNADLDRWYARIRSPYERVFAHQSKRVRYLGLAKNHLTTLMQTIAFNLKRLAVLDPPGIVLT